MTTSDVVAVGMSASRMRWLAGALALSGALIAVSEWVAVHGSATLPYYIFWIAYFLALVPIARLLVSSSLDDSSRGGLVAALAVWSLCPSLVRTGNSPLYFDEFSHFRMLQDLVRSGHPVSSTGLLQIGANFPGLELVSSGIYHLTGLTLWMSAIGVIVVAHASLLCGVYVLLRDVSGSSRGGAVAALIYSLNPSWMFFDSQFSYESLAFPLAIWGLVFALRAAHARPRSESKRVLVLETGVAIVITSALVIVHHVSAVIYCGELIVIAVVASLQRRHSARRPEVPTSPSIAWGLAIFAIMLTTLRFIDIGRPLYTYLGRTLKVSQEFSQLLSLFGIGAKLPLHSAFGGSSAPLFEVICSYAMIPVLLVLFVWAIWGLCGHRHELSPLAYVGALLGVLFFVSLPLGSAAAYSEYVHRSWGYSYLGIAIVLGLATTYDSSGRLRLAVRQRRLWPPSAAWRQRLRPVPVTFLAILAIGGVAVGTSTQYRFGGPVAPQTDPLYVGSQTQMVASWFSSHTSSRDVVWGNRFVVRPIAIDSTVRIAYPSGPELLLLLSPVVPQQALRAFVSDHVTYIVFDRRTGLFGVQKPWFWYVELDSNLPNDSRSTIFSGRISCLNWANAIFATADYEVLQVDRSQLVADLHSGQSEFRSGCRIGAAR